MQLSTRPQQTNAALVTYGLAGLRRCWMPDRAAWSHKYHLDGRPNPNESVPHSDLYYSLNVLLGLARVRMASTGEPYDIPSLLETICGRATGLSVRNGFWGMAGWAAAELDLALPGSAADRLRGLADPARLASWTAQDLGLSLSGVCAQARRDRSWDSVARGLRDILVTRFRGPGALFRDSGRGFRRHIATFATQVYAGLALYHYGELYGDEAASQAADATVRKLIELQGPAGEWPWFYLPARDQVLDPYAVYSVHQHGMGPALLHHAVIRGLPGARQAIEKGFRWLYGQNAMGRSMFVPELQLIYRSQVRSKGLDSRDARLLRAGYAALTRRTPWPDGRHLRLTAEMRSYEFGWLLFSFGASDDYPELTHSTYFTQL